MTALKHSVTLFGFGFGYIRGEYTFDGYKTKSLQFCFYRVYKQLFFAHLSLQGQTYLLTIDPIELYCSESSYNAAIKKTINHN